MAGAPVSASLAMPVNEEEAFKLLLSNSLSGFAILTGGGQLADLAYVFVSDSLCALLNLDKAMLEGRPLSEFLRAEDRGALAELLSELGKVNASAPAGDAPPSPPSSPYVRVRHACGDRSETRRLVTWKPVEVRAFAEAGLTYLALLDASMPPHVDSRLSDLLAFASHDMRTPVSSILTTVSLMRGMPAVASDREAASLLSTVDAACVMLLRCVANVLFMRSARKSGDEPRTGEVTPVQRPFNVRACVMSAVQTISALDSVPPRLFLTFEADRPLPDTVIGDEGALQACILNVTMMAMRMGAWLQDVPVRMRIAAEIRAHRADASRLRAQSAGRREESVTVTVASEAEQAGGSAEGPTVKEVMLLAITEAPGRPLSRAEVIDLMQPYGILPADKGGSTGLPLHVASALAKATGGDLEIYPTEDNSTAFALHMLVHAAIDEKDLQTAGAAAHEVPLKPASMRDELRLAPPSLVPELPGRRDEQQVHLTKHMFECLARNCADIFAICRVQLSEDGSGMCTWLQYVSPSLAWVFGMQPASVFGKPLDELCHPEDRAGFLQALLAASKTHLRDILFAHHGRGEILWCRTAGMYRGNMLYTVCRTSSLPVSVQLGIRAFDLAVSHELREPVNTVVVSLQVLRTRPCMRDAAAEAAHDTAGPAAPGALGAAELLSGMLRGASLLEDIVGGIISTRELDTGDLALETSIFSPGHVIEGVVSMCRAAQPTSESGDASIEWHPRGMPDAAALPALVVGDRKKFALICQNLITNAVKFKSSGSVVDVRAGSTEGDGARVVVTVANAGHGMTPEEAKACFTAGIAAPSSQGGGTGLGLFLSRAFANLMGGALTVRTAIDEGATFRLELPLPVVDPDTASTRTALALESDAAALLAVEWSAVQRQHAAMAAGVAEAHAEAESMLDTVAATAPAAAARRNTLLLQPAPLRLIRVLVAEDHVLNLRLLTRLLSLNGFAVTGVGDGRAALNALIASFGGGDADAANQFDVALLDMDMPHLSGPEASAEYRRWEATNRPGCAALPIVALTANALDEHVLACSHAGMSLFFSKPLRDGDIALLQAHAAVYINQRRLETAAKAADWAAIAAAEAAAAETARQALGLPAVAKGLEAAKTGEKREE